MIDSSDSPINGLTYAPEWSGTNIFLSCRSVENRTKELYPVELSFIARSAPLRRNTFSTGRVCARSAMSEAGLPTAALPRNGDGSVSWPEGVIGSLSHTDDWAVAAVALQAMSEAISLGVDLERIKRLEEGVVELIATPAEQADLTDAGNKEWHATALFSLKESIYKCLRPAYGKFIEFHEVEILGLVSGRPQLKFLNQELRNFVDPLDLELRMAVTSEHVFTLAWRRQKAASE